MKIGEEGMDELESILMEWAMSRVSSNKYLELTTTLSFCSFQPKAIGCERLFDKQRIPLKNYENYFKLKNNQCIFVWNVVDE